MTFAAQVVNASPESTADPTGSVQFYVDGTPYGDPVPLNEDGAATVTDSDLPAGTHQITAGFLPDNDNLGASLSETPATQVVTFADTTTTVFSGPSSPVPVYGQSVTFAAQVVNASPESTADPTGSVQFYVDGTPYGDPVPLNEDGAATVTDSDLPAGTHQITAGSLPDNDNFGASLSETPATQVVTFADTTTTVFSGPTPSVYGQAVTFAAQVVNASAESTADPTGSVEFYVDGTPYGSAPLDADGKATITDDSLPAGTHQITAGFLPENGNFGASLSETPATQVVTFADTATTVFSGPTPSVYGQSVTFAAQVVNASPESTADPTGSVEFYVDGTPYGSAPLDADGKATITDDSLPAGTHQITAGFLPENGNFGASLTEIPATQVVTQTISTNSIKVSLGGLVYNRTTRQFTQTLTITNISGAAIAGPIELVLLNLNNATLVNQTGVTQGSPYITVLSSGSLGVGQSVTIALVFADPTLATITYTPEFLAGPIPPGD